MSNVKLLIALTIDTDSDYYFGDKFASISKQDKSILGWYGLDVGKNILVNTIEDVSKQYGIPIPITWFIRCDYQVGKQNGNPAFLLKLYNDWWQKRYEKGDDIQWHAHLYRQVEGIWKQETSKIQLRKDLEVSLDEFIKSGFNPSIIRIGESYHSNKLMKIISELGLNADSSAMPGRIRKDEEKVVDWLHTPNFPYHPSKKNYRISGEKNYDLWELPLNTVTTKVSYDKKPILRYVNLSFQPGILDKGVLEFIKKNNILVSITHPFEIVDKFFSDSKSSRHPLLSFRPESVSYNLRMIIKSAQSIQKEVEFVTMSQLLESRLIL
jgi:hypothetical protein